jgi:hypothetical protein
VNGEGVDERSDNVNKSNYEAVPLLGIGGTLQHPIISQISPPNTNNLLTQDFTIISSPPF